MIILPFLLAFAVQITANAPDKTTELLRAKDQALLDAIAPGERKVWDQALAADAVYVDENGTIMDRAEFLKQLEPLPSGASGTLKITSYSAHISGDLATVVHTDDEQENYHGQMLSVSLSHDRDLASRSGEWKLYMVHTYAVLKDPPAISLPAQELQQYVGRYVGGPDLVYLIQWDGKQLVGGRQGRPMKPWRLRCAMFSSARGNRESEKSFSGTPTAKSRDSWTGGKAGTSSGAAKAPVLRSRAGESL